MKFFLLAIIEILSLRSFCQQAPPATTGYGFNKFSKVEFIQTDSGVLIHHFNSSGCKNFTVVSSYLSSGTTPKLTKGKIIPAITPKLKFLTIHGNISYDFFYRSRIDTPFNQNDLQQHTEKIYLDMVLLEKYPVKASFVLRQSNSTYARNFTDPSFQFDPYSYRKNLKQELLSSLTRSLGRVPELKAIEALLLAKEKELLALKGWLENPATLQKIIEERERQYGKQFITPNAPAPAAASSSMTAGDRFRNSPPFNNPAPPNPLADSNTVSISKQYENKQARADSLQKNVESLRQREDSLHNAVQKNISATKQKITAAGNENDLMKIAAANGLEIKDRNKLQKKLAGLRSFNIGRSIVNYTELTAKDISVTGMNAAYNPSYYIAFAAGKIDYRFRDFYSKRKNNNNGQYLLLGRFGFGNPDKRALIMTIFKGQKNPSEFVLNDSVPNHIGIIGYSVEAILKKNAYSGISLEVAKSTKPVAGNPPGNKQLAALWHFSDQSNAGINIKGQTRIRQTNTNLSGFIRKTGQTFQSFSLFTYNSDQLSWLIKAEQYFFKERLGLTGMLRRNDFMNPYTEKTYKSSTVFKSMLLNLRVPKYPTLSIGYYPGTQLFIVNKETLRESAYYLLNGSMAYSYFYKRTGMNSSLIYSRYFNQATDSGFLSYKGISYYAMQTIFFRKFQLQAGYAYNSQPGLRFSTVEGSADYSLNRSFKIGLGTKYNKVFQGKDFWGERIQLLSEIGKLGRLQLQYEKSYLPTITHTLFAVEIGRVSWYKYF